MIYSYNYLNPKIVKGQSFVNYIVLEILCRSQKIGMPVIFDEEIVIDKYKSLISQVNPTYIKNPLNSAYQICKKLKPSELRLLKKAIHTNLNIQEICEGTVEPILFSDIKKIDKELANHLYIFCKKLYTEVMKLKPFTDIFGLLKDHYEEFSKINILKSRRCPFCGFARMLSEYNSKKEAYDHFLPKEQYPFISIYFKNLIPMCHTCNSSYKSRKNPIDIQKVGIQKKVFYSYFNYGKINFEIEFKNLDLINVKPNEIVIKNSLVNYEEEVNSWEDIFGIQERYKSIYAGDSFNWLEEARIATSNFGESYANHKLNLNVSYYSNENFMKLAMLEACERELII